MTETATVGAVAAANGSPLAEGQVPSHLDQFRKAFTAKHSVPRLFKRFLYPTEYQLVGEYRLPQLDEIEPLDEDNDLASASDILITYLEAIHIHAPDHKDANEMGLVDLAKYLELDTIVPLKFDTRFTEAAGLPPGTAREIVLALFDKQEPALGAAALEFMQWTTDTNNEEYQDFK